MGGKINTKALKQQWMHSHEEDTDTEMVFRPASFKFPLSRGRTGFELKPNGRLIELGIAPTDRRQRTEGTWKLEDDDQLRFYAKSKSESSRAMQIVSVDNDRLVVKK